MEEIRELLVIKNQEFLALQNDFQTFLSIITKFNFISRYKEQTLIMEEILENECYEKESTIKELLEKMKTLESNMAVLSQKIQKNDSEKEELLKNLHVEILK